MQIFSTQKKPFSVGKLGIVFKENSHKVNKTTLYREIDFFVKIGTIKEVFINSAKKYYESSDLKHHHHAICNSCGGVEDVYLKRDVIGQHKRLESTLGFRVKDHSLEFFGLCSNCK